MTTNEERARELMRLAGDMNTDAMLTQFHADAVMELPFAPGKMQRRYEGIDAVRGFMAFARDSFSEFSMSLDGLHLTADPNVVICEHHSNAVVAENGHPYNNVYCTIITFDDDGMVTRWREYYDAGVVVRAFRRG
jgi:ketosteroid isomerase-like protein